MSYYASFLGDASKFQVLIFDEKLNILSLKKGNTINTNFVDKEYADKQIAETFDRAVAEAQVSSINEAYGCLCGYNYDCFDLIRRVLPLCNVYIVDAGYLYSLAATLGEKSILVISDAGSMIKYVENGYERISTGGYGMMLGDEGSSSDIANLAIKAAIKANSGWGTSTMLGDMLYQYVGSTQREEIVKFFYYHNRKDITGNPHKRILDFMEYVIKASRSGDKVAKQIIMKSAVSMAEQTHAFYKSNPFLEGMPAHIYLESWKNSKYFQQYYLKCYRKYLEYIMPGNSLQEAQYASIVGGVIFYLKRFGLLDTMKEYLHDKYSSIPKEI